MLHWLQLVMRLQIRPTPDSAVDDMWKALTVGDLQAAIERSRNGDTLGGLSRMR